MSIKDEVENKVFMEERSSFQAQRPTMTMTESWQFFCNNVKNRCGSSLLTIALWENWYWRMEV